MTGPIYEFQIPDPTRPLARSIMGPSGELVDFKPSILTTDMVVGRTVDQVSPIVGTYGMGGPGFFGIRLGSEWLVIAIWGAADWIQVDGRIVLDMFWEKNARVRPWITEEGDELSALLVGQPITSFEVNRFSLKIGIGERTLSITESPESRPILEGTKQPRRFKRDDDLKRAVFLSPTAEIWV